jgi:hypothetical protein
VPADVVWRTLDEAIDWLRLQDGAYGRIDPDANGNIENAAFSGPRLHVASMLAGHSAGVLATPAERRACAALGCGTF